MALTTALTILRRPFAAQLTSLELLPGHLKLGKSGAKHIATACPLLTELNFGNSCGLFNKIKDQELSDVGLPIYTAFYGLIHTFLWNLSTRSWITSRTWNL